MKIIIKFLFLLLLMFNFSCDSIIVDDTADSDSTEESTDTAEAEDTSYKYTDYEKYVLDEVNYARTKPAAYAEERLLSYYNSGKDNGSYLDIKSYSALSALELQNQLNEAARKYAKFLADNDKWGHEENGTPSERCKKEGYLKFTGENIAAGSYPNMDGNKLPKEAAVEFVLQWIIDEGIVGVGHRKNIMGSKHKKLGVGFASNASSSMKNYTVQDFGGE